MLSCVRCRKRLGAYLDGELSERQQASLERHLAGCGSCRAALHALLGLEPLLRNLDVPPAPAALTSQIMTQAYARRRSQSAARRPWSWWQALTPQFGAFRMATAAALITGLAVGAYMGWTRYGASGPARPATTAAWNEPVDETLYAFDVLSAAPQGSIEAATLALLEDGR
jgi:anti-sigma factor RsiW